MEKMAVIILLILIHLSMCLFESALDSARTQYSVPFTMVHPLQHEANCGTCVSQYVLC